MEEKISKYARTYSFSDSSATSAGSLHIHGAGTYTVSGTAEEALAPDARACALEFWRMLEGIPTIEELLAYVRDWGLSIWTITNNPTEGIRHQIYAKEWELMQQFPKLGVSFHLIDRKDQPLNQLVTLHDVDLHFLRRKERSGRD